MSKEAQKIADLYLKDPKYDDPFDLSTLISERVEYYSDRWSNDGVRFEVIRILLDECQKRLRYKSLAKLTQESQDMGMYGDKRTVKARVGKVRCEREGCRRVAKVMIGCVLMCLPCSREGS